MLHMLLIVISNLQAFRYFHVARANEYQINEPSASQFKAPMTVKTHCGSLAPEAHLHGKVYTQKVDMWSVGVIGSELATTSLPNYPSGSHRNWPRLLKQRLETNQLGPQFLSFIGALLHTHLDRRSSAQHCREARFLQIKLNFLDGIGSPTF